MFSPISTASTIEHGSIHRSDMSPRSRWSQKLLKPVHLFGGSSDRASTKRRIRLANPPHRPYRRRHTGKLIVVEATVSTMIRNDAPAVGPYACAILHSPPSTSPLVAQGDSFAGTLHRGPAGPVVSNTPAFHGRANSPVDTNQTAPRGLIGDQPLRKWRIQKG
jgi:hypothetical protein